MKVHRVDLFNNLNSLYKSTIKKKAESIYINKKKNILSLAGRLGFSVLLCVYVCELSFFFLCMPGIQPDSLKFLQCDMTGKKTKICYFKFGEALYCWL